MDAPRGYFIFSWIAEGPALALQNGGTWLPRFNHWMPLPPRQQEKVRAGLQEICLSQDGLAFLRFRRVWDSRLLDIGLF
jgi:hypothetical protein